MNESLQNTMVSRDYFDNIIKSMMDTLIVLDKKAKIRTVNPATCQLLGYTEKDLIGQPASILFAEEEVYRVFQFFREPEKAGVIRPQDTIRNRELTYKTKDGRLIPMLFNASVICDKTGNITGVVAGAKDITDLKLAEVATRKEKTFSENITATIPDSLLVLDKDLRIKRANRSFYKVFGKEHEEVIGARITDILGDEDGRLSSELTRLLGTEDNIEYFELHYPSEKLGERIFSITARNIIFEEEEELLVIRDITEQEKMKNVMMQYEKLSSLGQLSAGLAHKLRNPLAVISSCAQFCMKNMHLAPPLNENLQIIYQNIQRANKLINDLLAFARPFHLEWKEVDINEIVNRMLSMGKLEISPFGVTFVRQLQNGLPKIRGDEEKLGQVFLNLILNAIQAVSNKGKIILQT